MIDPHASKKFAANVKCDELPCITCARAAAGGFVLSKHLRLTSTNVPWLHWNLMYDNVCLKTCPCVNCLLFKWLLYIAGNSNQLLFLRVLEYVQIYKFVFVIAFNLILIYHLFLACRSWHLGSLLYIFISYVSFCFGAVWYGCILFDSAVSTWVCQELLKAQGYPEKEMLQWQESFKTERQLRIAVGNAWPVNVVASILHELNKVMQFVEVTAAQ